MTTCELCGRELPLGGVLDHVGRPVHDWCKGMAKLEIASLAQATAKRVAKEGKPSPRPKKIA
jgi:hypothetical protein